MYPITRESVMVVISSSVAEKAVCWCDGRKKRSRRIPRRLTHLAGFVQGRGGPPPPAAGRAGAAPLPSPSRAQLGTCDHREFGLAAEHRLFAGEGARVHTIPGENLLYIFELSRLAC